jgi:glucan phosphorylase
MGRRHRFLQETIFAQCVPRLFKRLGVIPDALLINEGHVAVAGAITRGDPVFDKTAILYTNHTVVPAGLEVFDVDELVGDDLERARYIMRFPSHSWQWLWKKFIVESEGKVLIDFSKGALEICSAANAVSAEHAGMTRSLFPSHNKHIHPILNGSGDTWVQRELLELERQGIQPSGEVLLEFGLQGKRTAQEAIRRRTMDLTNQQGKVIAAEGRELSLDMPAVWLVRRLVDYKSQYPILKEIIQILCADRDQQVDSRWGLRRGLGMQVVVGGVAPPNCHEQTWIEAFVQWMERPDLNNRFFFVPGGDSELLRLQAIGADICLNCPQPGREACGTSDQRSARNGGINIAVHSGGPPEYLVDGTSGMLIGPYINNSDFFDLAPKHILEKLETLADMYYAQGQDDLRWREMKLQSYLASRQVSAAAMEQRYAPVYVQAIRSRLENLEEPEAGYPLEAVENSYPGMAG